jgi:hypothetical protein
MEWDDDAKEMLEMVPAGFRSQAVSGTENYAKNHDHSRVTTDMVDGYRKELSF